MVDVKAEKTAEERLDGFRTDVINMAAAMHQEGDFNARTATLLVLFAVTAGRENLLGHDGDDALDDEMKRLNEMGILPNDALTMFKATLDVERMFTQAFGHGS